MSKPLSLNVIIFKTALNKTPYRKYCRDKLQQLFACSVTLLNSPNELGHAAQVGLENTNSRTFVVGTTNEQMNEVHKIAQLEKSSEVVGVALRGTTTQNGLLEQNGADFVVSNFDEVVTLATTTPIHSSLSVVLLAYNEEAMIKNSTNDVHRFCQLYAPNYEVIIIDDGSRDATPQLARALTCKNVRVISHKKNQGMGASMKDGYEAARNEYVVSLPGDRQVKAHSLAAFLPFISKAPKDLVVLSQYVIPHSGKGREIMSATFRMLLRHVGDLNVDFAGAYLFSKSLFTNAAVSSKVASQTFLYSFQLLESFKKNGARFKYVDVVPFPREVGQSREATVGRVIKMTKEIVKHRFHSKFHRLLR